MPQSSFALPALFQQAFGFMPEVLEEGVASPVQTSATGAPYYASGLFGRSYFMPVTLTYTLSGTPTESQEEYDLPNPVISVKGSKKIVKTSLSGRRGDVKELINMKDYEITINGLIINTTNDFPEEETGRLCTLFEQKTAMQIKCAFTDLFLLQGDGLSGRVVIETLEFPEQKGIKNVRPYKLTLISDEDFNLTEIQAQPQ